MSIADIPTNVNFLSPIGFRLTVKELPNVEFFCQSANIPGLSISEVIVPTPLNPTYQTGDQVQYEELNVRVLADEYMNNWSEIHNWITGLGSPQNQEQYAKQLKKFIKTDITMFVMTAGNTPSIKFDFLDCFPTSLSSLQFDIGGSGGEYLTFDIMFRYNSYKYETLINTNTK